MLTNTIAGYVSRIEKENEKVVVSCPIRDESGTLIKEDHILVYSPFWLPLRKHDIVRLVVSKVDTAASLLQSPINVVIQPETDDHVISLIVELGRMTPKKAKEFYTEIATYLSDLQRQTSNALSLKDIDETWRDKLPKTEECKCWHFLLWKPKDMISYHSCRFKEGDTDKIIERILDKYSRRWDILLRKWQYEGLTRIMYVNGIKKYMLAEMDDNMLDVAFRLKTNPYFYPQIPLELADTLAQNQGLNLHPVIRFCGCVVRKLYWYLTNKKWTMVPKSLLIKFVENIDEIIPTLQTYFQVKVEEIADETCFMLPHPYQAEKRVADNIKQMVQIKIMPYEPEFDDCKLHEIQKQGVEMALNYAISIITGSAGTGKTTIIKEIVHNLKLQGKPYMCASFTGKAVARIKEVVKTKNASTLDSLIRRQPIFTHLIIDEISMVSTSLLAKFFKVFPPVKDGRLRYSITLIGDINQLEPIDWGLVFNELLQSESIPTVRLTCVFRTDVDIITRNANKLLQMSTTTIVDEFDEFDFYDTDSTEIELPFETSPYFQIIDGGREKVFELVSIFHSQGVSIRDITCIVPFSKARLYVDDTIAINDMFRQIYLPGAESFVDIKKQKWHKGERVMHTVNIASSDLYNGDEGIVTRFDKSGIYVKYGDNEIFYNNRYDNLIGKNYVSVQDLTLDYVIKSSCMTCHKAQGSEYKVLIVFVPKYNGKFITRNWLYTAMTRSKKRCYLVGDTETMSRVISNLSPSRKESLRYRLRIKV